VIGMSLQDPATERSGLHDRTFPVEPIVPPSAAPSRPVNFGSGDLDLIAACV
jgi:hypothetical protein